MQDLKKTDVTEKTTMASNDGENTTDGDRTSLEKTASAISVINKEMTDSKLYEEMNVFCYEIKGEMEAIKKTAKSLEKSMEEAWACIQDLKDESEAHKSVKTQQQSETDVVKKELCVLK